MKNPINSILDKVVRSRVEVEIRKIAESDVQVRALLERKGYIDNESQYSPENREDYLALYEKYIWVYAAVYAIATNAAKVPFRIYQLKRNQQRGAEILDGPYWNLFNRPNPLQSYFDIIEAAVSSMELAGGAYLEKGGPNPQQPTQLYVLRPDWVEIVPNPRTLIGGYRYKVNGQYINFTPEQVCYIKYYHPRSELYGLSPIGPSTNSAILDLFTLRYQKNFFKQGAMMNTYVTVPKSLSDKEFQRFKEQLRADYAGVDRAHMIGVFDSDAKLEELGVDPQKILLTAQRNMNRNEVLAAFGVPPIMVGLLDAATFNNTQEQKKAFWENTMVPKLQKLANKFNQEFLWPNELEGEFDLKTVPALQEDDEKKQKVASGYVRDGILTPNEARKDYLNKDPLPGGDTLSTAAPMASALQASAGAQDQSAENRMNASLVDVKKSIKDQFTKQYGKYVLEYDGVMRKFFDSILKSILPKIKASYPKSGTSIKKNDLVTEAFNSLDDESIAMMEDLVALHEDVIDDTSSKKYQDIKKGPRPRTVASKARAQASKNAQIWAEKSNSSIVKTMQDRTALFMDEAIAKDMDLPSVIKGVTEIFQGTEREAYPWARTIARTETSKAVNYGKMEGMKQAGILYKEWIAADGPTGRPDHTALGQLGPVPIDYVYETDNGEMLFPGDPNADVSDLCNCRCTITEILEAPEDTTEEN